MNQCSTCQRHFFATEADCPFCRDMGSGAGRQMQKVAVAGAAALILAGCLPQPTPVYGAPVPPVASPSASPNPAP
jgi:hypothetical protein